MEDKIIREMADGIKFSLQRSAETIAEEKVEHYRAARRKQIPRQGPTWDEASRLE